jgi:hypothetical protein
MPLVFIKRANQLTQRVWFASANQPSLIWLAKALVDYIIHIFATQHRIPTLLLPVTVQYSHKTMKNDVWNCAKGDRVCLIQVTV